MTDAQHSTETEEDTLTPPVIPYDRPSSQSELIEKIVKVQPKQYLNLLYFYFRSLFPPKNKKVKVIIYGQGRSGSTLLENLICSTGYFKERGEIIRNYRQIIHFPLVFVRGFSRHYFKDNFIFHVKIYQLIDQNYQMIEPGKFLRKLHSEGWNIIYLNRQNILRQLISKEIAMQSNVYHRKNQVKISKKYFIDLERLSWELDLRIQLLAQERQHLQGLNYVGVNYESDLLDGLQHQSTVDRILDHLGLQHRPVQTKFHKTGQKNLSDSISNFDEFLSLIKTKGWESYLD